MDTDTIPWHLRAMLDPFVTLSVAASLTERVLLGASTMVAPWYSPLPLARSLTGVDVLWAVSSPASEPAGRPRSTRV
ncbi:hypothetical protein [Streptomyces parvulus]|uniref:hypothetical protein n=1 Tax=Streptomyces parvulus TaxID=146923 RepID=UPI003818A37A